MRFSLVFASIIVAINLLAQPNKGAPQNTQGTTDAQRTVALVCKESPATDAQEASAGPPRWYTALKQPDWWLVGVAIATLVVLYRQASEMRKATEAMERSSGIHMDAEQGRLLTYWEKFIHLDASPDGARDGALSHHFNWACGNVGKTQATLIEVWARFISVRRLSDLPEKPDYSARNTLRYQGEPLLPVPILRPQTEWFSTPLETALSYEEMEAKYRSNGCALYAYGYAKYIDVWGRPHETRFGLFYDAQPEMQIGLDGWVVAGPTEYNKST